jgi:hypothetical protein
LAISYLLSAFGWLHSSGVRLPLLVGFAAKETSDAVT